MVNIKLGILEMVEKARAVIEEVDVEDAIAEARDPDCLIIDVRDVRERKRDGYIPQSFHCPRGMIEFWLDPESPYFKKVFDEKPIIGSTKSQTGHALGAAGVLECIYSILMLKDKFIAEINSKSF